MPDEIDGTKAAFREPAWHDIGTVFGHLMTADEVISVLNPSGEPIRKGRVVIYVMVPDGEGGFKEVGVPAPDYAGLVDFDSDADSLRPLAVNGKDYPELQREELFSICDDVVGSIDGAHYEAGVNLRNGKQTVLTVSLGEYILDPGGIADVNKKYLWLFNSWNTSWALRFKMGDFRVVCANTASMALRGSSDKNVIGSEWSTRHTTNMMDRVEEVSQFLGLWRVHDKLFEAQAEHMIQCQLDDNTFGRIIKGLYTTTDDTGETVVDKDTVETVRATYELSAAGRDIQGTIWGGFNAITEHNDWVAKVRSGKDMSTKERRFLRGVEDPTGVKQRAWDVLWNLAEETKPFTLPDLAA